jgi:hypothetical protein
MIGHLHVHVIKYVNHVTRHHLVLPVPRDFPRPLVVAREAPVPANGVMTQQVSIFLFLCFCDDFLELIQIRRGLGVCTAFMVLFVIYRNTVKLLIRCA